MQASCVYDFDFEHLTNVLAAWGEPAYRARQIWQGLYRKYFHDSAEFTNLPNSLRKRLAEVFLFHAISPADYQESKDKQTQKSLFRLRDGLYIESVLMKYSKRRTLCISTQVGCAMGCIFCATGRMGLKRHLTSGEIVAQVMHYARLLNDEDEKVSNIVFMGMGEPFHNYENTMSAIDRLNDPVGYKIGARRLTVSTVGLIPAMQRFTQENRQLNLAVSLHAAHDELRSHLLPINKKYPLSEVLSACHAYINATGRRISFEWALIEGLNDTSVQADLLVQRVRGLNCHVNIIPLNPVSGFAGKAAGRKRVLSFKQILDDAGVSCTIRLRRGVDIQAGCGQLLVDSKIDMIK